VYVAAGDVDADGHAVVVTGAGLGGGPHVRMFSGADLFPTSATRPADGPRVAQVNFFAYSPHFTGGASVAVADLNGDGHADIVTGAGEGGGPHVVAFSGRDGAELANFFASDADLRTGVSVAAGDLDGDGRAEVVAAPLAGGSAHVRVFDADAKLTANYFAFDEGVRSGARLALQDLDADGDLELVAGTGPGVAPWVRVLDARTGAAVREFPGLTADRLGGLYVG
jgi:hypothetical protein